MAEQPIFNYVEAFSRNIGWITEWEQQQLRQKRVAIAGMGGVGGVHALTLSRLGIGGFHLSDMDEFEVANFNRQVAATMKTAGQQKVDVVASMVKDINPTLYVKVFGDGVHYADPDKGWEDNIEEFLDGIDLYVDGLDFFVFDVRRAVFKRCREKGIPVITAGPIGWGTAYLVFTPDGMTFDDYFDIKDSLTAEECYMRYMVGLTPTGLHLPALIDSTRVNIAGKKGPSTIAGAQLCAGVMAAEVAKQLLGRGPVYPVPWHHQFDAYRNKYARKYVPGGNKNPMQKLKLKVAAMQFGKLGKEAFPPYEPSTDPEMIQILDLARWAPSGDNSQPWKFEIKDDDTVVVSLHDQGEDDVYDYNNGQPSLLSGGFLIETMRIAASGFGRGMEWSYDGAEGHDHTLTVTMKKQDGIERDPLFPYIKVRSVNRKPYLTTPLTAEQRQLLTDSLGEEFDIRWYESDGEKRDASAITALSTDIRLRIPEAHHVHERILDWERNYSPTGVPASAAGVSPPTQKIMKWAMASWSRADFLNKYMAGTMTAKIELDHVPGRKCAAHFVVWSKQAAEPEDQILSYFRAGMAMQRFWLEATRIGLVMHPALAPLCFAFNGRHNVPFTENAAMRRKATDLALKMESFCPVPQENLVFMGRIGTPKNRNIGPRSIRKELSDLMIGD